MFASLRSKILIIECIWCECDSYFKCTLLLSYFVLNLTKIKQIKKNFANIMLLWSQLWHKKIIEYLTKNYCQN